MNLKSIMPHWIRYPDPNDHNALRSTVLVRVETADGVVGWGEGIAMWPEACKATCLLINEGYGPILMEADALTVEAAWDLMRAHSWWYGEGGIANFALSAIDMALWDIAGKQANTPLYALMGGREPRRLPTCASCHVNWPSLEKGVEEVSGFFSSGFQSVKLGFGKKGPSPIGQDPERVVEFVTLLRDRLGPNAEIIVDIGNGIRWDRAIGITVAKALHALKVEWIEEPFYPTLIGDYRALRDACAIPVGSGEREWTAAGYERLLATDTVDVFGVDPARVEGISGFRAVDARVAAAGKTINAHAWSTAITSAASLHLSAASPSARLFELKPYPVVVQDELSAPFMNKAGGLAWPLDKPGLGVEIDEGVVVRLTVQF